MGMFEPSELARTSPSSEPDRCYPVDFTSDEREFTQALQGLFSPECEDLPPLYVQTLAGDASARPIDPGFEQKMTYRVFNQLGLERSPLFDAPLTPGARRARALRRLGRSGTVLTACAMLFMALSVVIASPSFAAGMRILLGHTGVQQVKSYPSNVRPSASMVHLSTGHAQQPLNWIDWFGPTLGHYSYENMEVSAPQEWSDGPIVDVRYVVRSPSSGSGELDVREFHIAPTLSSILQVVAEGSAVPVQVGSGSGVYVDGQWLRDGQRPTWQSGVREELIFERDGLIFWIVADQRDGLGATDLAAAAQQLTQVSMAALSPEHPSLRIVGRELQDSLAGSSNNDVFALIPAGSSADDGPAAFVEYAPGMPVLH
jgi:hypothetical protein